MLGATSRIVAINTQAQHYQAELVRSVTSLRPTKKHSEVIVDTVFKIISTLAPVRRSSSLLRQLLLRKREPRKGRNPKTAPGDVREAGPYFSLASLKDLITRIRCACAAALPRARLPRRRPSVLTTSTNSL